MQTVRFIGVVHCGCQHLSTCNRKYIGRQKTVHAIVFQTHCWNCASSFISVLVILSYSVILLRILQEFVIWHWHICRFLYFSCRNCPFLFQWEKKLLWVAPTLCSTHKLMVYKAILKHGCKQNSFSPTGTSLSDHSIQNLSCELSCCFFFAACLYFVGPNHNLLCQYSWKAWFLVL